MRKLFVVVLTMSAALGLKGQVTLQTGSANFNLPIFNWTDDKSRLNSIVALEYNSGNGLKIDEIASNIGQGWSLVAGGAVTRMQVGEPDDQLLNDGTGTSDINKYPAGYLYSTHNASLGCPNGLYYYPLFGDQNHVYKQHNTITDDREQDYFSVQFNGRAVMFVLGKNNGDNGIVLGNSKLKIWFTRNPTNAASQHIRTTISAFYVQDENGIVYTYSQLALSKVLRVHQASNLVAGFNDMSFNVQQPVTEHGLFYETFFDEIPQSYNPNVVNGWYLTSIKDNLTNRTITFNYVTRNLNNATGDVIKYVNTSTDGVPAPRYVQITRHVSIAQTPEISSIQYPDGHVVNFNYDMNNPRVDLKGDYPLRSVDVKYNSRYAGSYVLNNPYFILNSYGYPKTEDQRLAARLCLRSVTKLGPDLKESQSPYVFDYFTGTNATEDFVPPPFYYAKDIYGYYNGSYINNINPNIPAMPLLTTQLLKSVPYQLLNNFSFDQVCALAFSIATDIYPHFNSVHAGFSKNGLLKSITYPAGKTLTYDYQQNAYNEMTDQNTVTHTSTMGVGAYAGGVHVSQIAETDGGYSNGNGNPIITRYNYVDSLGVTSQWGYETVKNGVYDSYALQVQGGHSHPFGSCSYDYAYPGILSKDEAQNVNDNNANASVLMKVLNYSIMAISLGMDIAFVTTDPGALIFDVVNILMQWLLTNCDMDAQNGSTFTNFNYDLNENNTFPIQFSRVEVLKGGSLPGIGKTIYEFTDFHDYPLWDVAKVNDYPYVNPNSMKQRGAPWAYGLPKKVTVYDAGGNIVKQTESKYSFSFASSPASADVSCNCAVGYKKPLRGDVWGTYASASAMSYYPTRASASTTDIYPQVYQVNTGRVEVTDTYDRAYKQNSSSQYEETGTHYDYNPNNFQVRKIKTTASNGDTLYREIYYPGDYSYTTGPIAQMKTNNIVNDVVASYSSVKKAGSSTINYLGAKVFDYTLLSTGQIIPVRTLVSRSATPVSSYTFNTANAFNYPNLMPHSTYFYNDQGIAIATEDEGGRWVTNIFDYDGKYIVGSVANADPYFDKPAYTSFETDYAGGWTVNGTAGYTSSMAITGSRAFVLSAANSLSAYLNSAKFYILSFWASNSTVSVSAGAILVKSGPVINGFTYYEYAVSAGTSAISLSAAGTVNIDELRLYPNTSRMRTTTYDPVIGKTADCDENNRITYYEYDDLGRIRFIKDENRNVVKMYEYNSRMNANSVGTSFATTFSGTPYAKIAFENVQPNDWFEQVGDLRVSFFIDAACTIPVYVSNVTVSFKQSEACDAGVEFPPMDWSASGSGTSFLLGHFNLDSYFDTGTQTAYCQLTYTLNPGNYIIK